MGKGTEFPRVVYGPNGATKTIHSEDERPDGYFNTPHEAEHHNKTVDDRGAAEEAKIAAEKREHAVKVLDAEGVKYAKNAQTKTLEKRVEEVAAEKTEMAGFLTEHDVSFDADANHATLFTLTEKLKKHLEAQASEAGETPQG